MTNPPDRVDLLIAADVLDERGMHEAAMVLRAKAAEAVRMPPQAWFLGGPFHGQAHYLNDPVIPMIRVPRLESRGRASAMYSEDRYNLRVWRGAPFAISLYIYVIEGRELPETYNRLIAELTSPLTVGDE
jgi:hypothetical protein